MGVPPSTSRRVTKKQKLMYKSQAKLGVISAQAIPDGTYEVEKIEASKPKNGFCNPLLTLKGYTEKLYVHPTKLSNDCKTEGEAPNIIYTWRFPQAIKNLKVNINAGSVTIVYPDVTPPVTPTPPVVAERAW